MKSKLFLAGSLRAVLLLIGFENSISQNSGESSLLLDKGFAEHVARTIIEGRRTFRFDTFGDEAFWGGQLGLNQTIAGARFGGIGPGLSPRQALALGLKVDEEALPPALAAKLRGRV
jgi:hypothetical protein